MRTVLLHIPMKCITTNCQYHHDFKVRFTFSKISFIEHYLGERKLHVEIYNNSLEHSEGFAKSDLNDINVALDFSLDLVTVMLMTLHFLAAKASEHI